MSLIIASSSQEEYSALQGGAPTRTLAGLEAPSSFQNHFTSPIKVPKDAEIAVESVKIRRDALIDIENNCVMYKYFGKLQTTGTPGTGDVESRLEMPIPMRPRPGTYNTDDWVEEVKRILNESYGNPEIYNNYDVTQSTNASGQVDGIQIVTTQRGDSSAKNIAAAAGSMLTDYWQNPKQLTNPQFAPGTSWTSTTKGSTKEFTRLEDVNASNSVTEEMDRMSCSVIGHGHTLGLVDGFFKVDVSKAAKGWRVGLSRPQTEYVRDTTTQPVKIANLLPGTAVGGTSESGRSSDYLVKNRGGKAGSSAEMRNQKDFYDFVVENDGSNISIYQLSYDDKMDQLVQSEVVYYGQGGSNANAGTKMTTTGFNASFTEVEFGTVGDKLVLHFDGGAAGRQQILGNIGQTKRWESFLPISETRNALYPRLNIATQNEILTVSNYSSHYSGAIDFRFPTVVGNTFTTGDDFYTNNRAMRNADSKVRGEFNLAKVVDTKNRPYCLSQTLLCDTKDRMVVDQSNVSTAVSTYDAELAGNAGINKSSAFIIGWNDPYSKNYYLEGKYETETFSGQAKMNRTLGFPLKSFIDNVEGEVDGYVVSSAGGAVKTFKSFRAPEFRVHSAFVRLSNMPIQSYNGAKNSVSKILYHLPRFTNDGREFGDLFFAPGEKTYVGLHNTTPEILNNIEVQIVDVNERPIDDISGNTVVVFHLREKSR